MADRDRLVRPLARLLRIVGLVVPVLVRRLLRSAAGVALRWHAASGALFVPLGCSSGLVVLLIGVNRLPRV